MRPNGQLAVCCVLVIHDNEIVKDRLPVHNGMDFEWHVRRFLLLLTVSALAEVYFLLARLHKLDSKMATSATVFSDTVISVIVSVTSRK